MADPMQGIMSLPPEMGGMDQGPRSFLTPEDEAVLNQIRSSVSPRDFSAEMFNVAEQTDPQATTELRMMLQGMQIPADMVELLKQMVDMLLAEPERYPELRQRFLQEGVPEELLPPEFDPNFFAALNMALDQVSGPTVQGFAMGGMVMNPISEGIASLGRNGDTMLAHITPQEAMMLRRAGGAGTINPVTGLPEFFNLFKAIGDGFKKIGGVVKDALNGIGKTVKKFVRSDIGKIVTSVALGYFLGPAAAKFIGVSSLAGVSAVSGFLGSAGSTLLAGGSIKDALKSGAISGIAAAATAGLLGGKQVYQSGSYTGPTTVSEQWQRFSGNLANKPPVDITQADDLATKGLEESIDVNAGADFSVARKTPLTFREPGQYGTSPGAVGSREILSDIPEQSFVPAGPASGVKAYITPESTGIPGQIPQNPPIGPSPAATVSPVSAAEPGLYVTRGGTTFYGTPGPGDMPFTPGGPSPVPTNLPSSGAGLSRAGYTGPRLNAMTSPVGGEALPVSPELPGMGLSRTGYTGPRLNAMTSPAESGAFTSTSPELSGVRLRATDYTGPRLDAMGGTTGGGYGEMLGRGDFTGMARKAGSDVVGAYDEYFSPTRPSIQNAAVEAQNKALQAVKDLPAGTPEAIQTAVYNRVLEANTPGMLAAYGPLAALGMGAAYLGGAFDVPETPKPDIPMSGEERFKLNPYLITPRVRTISASTGAPYRYAAGGIADLAGGTQNFPRKTGAINGPGTGTSDSIPAMLSDGEFVFTAKAVRAMGKGSRRKGAKRMYALMKALEKRS